VGPGQIVVLRMNIGGAKVYEDMDMCTIQEFEPNDLKNVKRWTVSESEDVEGDGG
jgi:hypothetical protein